MSALNTCSSKFFFEELTWERACSCVLRSPYKMFICSCYLSAQSRMQPRRDPQTPQLAVSQGRQAPRWGPHVSIFSFRGSPCVLLPLCSPELFSPMPGRKVPHIEGLCLTASGVGLSGTLPTRLSTTHISSNYEEDTITKRWLQTWQNTLGDQSSYKRVYPSGDWRGPVKST